MKKTTNDLIEICHDYNLILDSREIFIHGYDTDDSGTDHRMATTFIKNLRILERSSEPIIIHSYNIGGEWSCGMAIFDCIKHSPCSFIFICHGIAASMGSIIPQAVLGKGYRISMPMVDWLLHEGDLHLQGIHTQVKSNLDYINLNNHTMYEIYTDCCINGTFFESYSRSKVKAFLKRKIREKTDWCIGAKEALDYGFVDGIFGEKGFETVDKIKSYL